MTIRTLRSNQLLKPTDLSLEALEGRVLLSASLPAGFELLGYIDPGELNLGSVYGAAIDAQGDLILGGSCNIYNNDYGTLAVHGNPSGTYELYIANVDLKKLKADWINFQSDYGDLVFESDGGIRPSPHTLFTSDGYLEWSFDCDIADNSRYDGGTTTGVQYRIKDADCYDTINGAPYGFGIKTEYAALEKKQVQESPPAFEWQTAEGETILHENSSGTITYALAVAPGNDTEFSYSNNYTVWFNDTTGVKQVSGGYRKVERHNATFSIDTGTGQPGEAVVFDYYWKEFDPYEVELIQMDSADGMTVFYNDESIYRLTSGSKSQVGVKEVTGDDYAFGRDGFIYLTGMLATDLYLAKYDTGGNKLWSTTFGGSGNEFDYPFEVGVDTDGNVMVMGRTNSADLPLVDPLLGDYNGYEQHFIAKFDASGSLKFSSYVPDLDVEHGGWGTMIMRPGYMAVEPDGDAIIGYTSSYIYKSRIVRMANVSAPSGSLADNYDEAGYALTGEINSKGYLDLALNGAVKNTVTGDELVLSGEGAAGVAVKGKPTLIDAANSIYRYVMSGLFSGGPVTVSIPAGTFENDKGVANVASAASFNSFPTMKVLETDKTPNDFTWDGIDKRFEYAGTFAIGPHRELTGGAFSPLITVEGELALDAETLAAAGTVSTTATGSSQGLFNGGFEILLDSDTTHYLEDEDGAVGAEITVAGLDVRYRGMKLTAANGTKTLCLQGDIKLPTEFGFDSITMTGDQYLVLTPAGRSCTGATMTLEDTEIDTAYLKMKAEDLSIEYVAAAGVQPEALRFRGKVTLPKAFNATADFTTDEFAGTDGYIEVNAKKELKWYGKLSVEEIEIVKDRWEIKKAALEVRDVPGVGMSVQGDGTFTVPPGMDIIGGLGFVNEELNYVKLGLDGLDLPIGTTGAFLQSIHGNVNNLADPDATRIQFGGGLGFTAGKKIAISLPDWAGGELEGALAEFSVEGGFSFEQLTGSGTVKLVGELAGGEATATLNWDKKVLEAQCQVSALNDLLGINGTMKADSSMNISIKGTGTVGIPSIIPIWGGKTLANGTTVFNFTNDDNYANDYVAGWGSTSITAFGKVYSMTAGIRVNFDGSYSFLGGKSAAKLQAGQDAVAQPAGSRRAVNAEPLADTGYASTQTFYAQAEQEWLLINAQWDNAAAGEITLTAPDGTEYDLAAIGNSDFIAVVPELTNETHTAFFIVEPAAGAWKLTVTSTEPLAGLAFDGYQDTALPELVIDAVAINSYSQTGTIQYSSDADLSGYQIAFYYDDDATGEDGILIGLADDSGRFSWDTSAVAAGSYHVYATISDGGNAPAAVYYGEPVTIEVAETLTDVLIGTGAAGKVSYADADGTVVTVSLNGDGGRLRFAGDGVVASGAKSVMVTGTNLILQTVELNGAGVAALSISAKGGSDNEAMIGNITGGAIKSISGKGVVLAGNIEATGALGLLSWGELGDNISIKTGAAGGGFSLKAGTIGSDVVFDIADSIKSFAANSFTAGQIACVSLGKFAVKAGDLDLTLTTAGGGVGSIKTGGDLVLRASIEGPLGSLGAAGGLSGVVRVKEGVGTVSAGSMTAMVSAGRDIAKVTVKGDMVDSWIMAGYDLGSDLAFGGDDTGLGGNLKSVAVAGTFQGSYLTAGALPAVGRTGASPFEIPWFAENGAIGSVKFGMIDYEHDELFGLFAATSIKPFKVGGHVVVGHDNFAMMVRQ